MASGVQVPRNQQGADARAAWQMAAGDGCTFPSSLDAWSACRVVQGAHFPGSNVEGDADILRNDDGNYFHAAAASGMRGGRRAGNLLGTTLTRR